MTRLSLQSYRLLGRSGLRVSPLSLGTMTFGSDWGWGADEDESRRLFDTYVDRGGNFIDTASMYTNGSSERLLGKFVAEKRERLVIATKYDEPAAGRSQRRRQSPQVDGPLGRGEPEEARHRLY
jgi:aryl-alcohol dehydrogenase-like predicted oxidoreductase